MRDTTTTSRVLGALFAGLLTAGVTAMAVSAEAPPGEQEVALDTSTATNYTSGEESCNFTGVDVTKSYWHFVLTPNDGTWAFKTIHLVTTGDADGSNYAFTPNEGQNDNVFVEVPAGVLVTDLVEAGSYAWIDPDSPTPRRFNLSHNCVADTPTEPEVSVSKTVDTNWDRTHRWSIDKTLVSGPTAVYSGDLVIGANLTYRVDVSELSAVDAYSVSGTITVANANDTPATVTEVTDNLPGFVCSVESLPADPVVVDGSPIELDYTCDPLASLPAGDLTNTATASYTYEGGEDSASSEAVPVAFSATPDEEIDADPVLTDDKYPGVIAGTEYTVYAPATTDNCVTGFTNTATLTGDEDAVLDTDQVTEKFCLSIGGRTIGFWSNKTGLAALGTGTPTIWEQVKTAYPKITSPLSTVASLQSFLTAKTTNCNTDCVSMLRAQFIATALNSLFIGGYGTQTVIVPTILDTKDGSANGCATVNDLLASVYAQYPFLTTAERVIAKTTLDGINQDKPINPFQCML